MVKSGLRTMNANDHRSQLIHILQMAYSGEKAAAFAYAGHWRSVRNSEERIEIYKIEQDEWEHRAISGSMLTELGAAPQAWREILMSTIGSAVFFACFMSGWYFPMYFAGLLENSNTDEYKAAAFHAAELGLTEYAVELSKLSNIELLHEQYFLSKVSGHPLTQALAVVFQWGTEPSLPAIGAALEAARIDLNLQVAKPARESYSLR